MTIFLNFLLINGFFVNINNTTCVKQFLIIIWLFLLIQIISPYITTIIYGYS
jgi:hypothetical protein